MLVATIFSFLSVVVWESVAVGDLLLASTRKGVSLPHTKELSDHLYNRIGADDIVDAHHAAHHSMPKAKQSEILNDWEQFIRGTNYNGKEVDIFIKDGRAVIIEAGDKTKVITAYGREFSVNGNPVNLQRWNFRFWQDGEFYYSPIYRNTQR